MNCAEARQYIIAFLDNELDSALSIDVQQHIEHCPRCARECEIENVVRRQLAARMQTIEDVPAFDEPGLLRLLSFGVAPAGPRRPRTWRLYALGAVAAMLLFAVTLFVANSGREAPGASLADALVEDFNQFVTKSKPLQIVSSDPEAVSDWLRERTALAVSVPRGDRATATLLGGRKCKINGAPAAFAVYRIGDELVSVVALRGPDDAFASMKPVEHEGHTHWVDHCRGHTVLACRRGELIYAIVSRLPEEVLSPLMVRDAG